MLVQALGMIVNDPQRVPYALLELKPYFSLGKDVDGYGVATCAGTSVLLKRAPGAMESQSLCNVVGLLKGACTIGQFRMRSDIRPIQNSMSANNLGPFRYQNMCGLSVGGSSDTDVIGANRDKILSTLPDNLLRMIQGKTEAEVLFYGILSQLGSGFHLLSAADKAKKTKEAIESVSSQLEDDSPRAFLVALGQDIVVYQKEMRASCVNIRSIDPALLQHDWQGAQVAPATKHQLAQFRGAFVFLGDSSKSDAQSSAIQTRVMQEKCFWLNSDMGVAEV